MITGRTLLAFCAAVVCPALSTVASADTGPVAGVEAVRQVSAPQERSSVEADTFRDEAVRLLIRRARVERGNEAAGLASWEATIRERISVGLTTQDLRRDRGLFTSERVGRVRWDSAGVETIRWFGIKRAVPIVGDRAEIDVGSPEDLETFPLDPAGDRLNLGGSPFHHPLAPDAGQHYRFASGDTMRVILPSGEEIILAEVRVEPRESDFEVLAGSLWFDLRTAALVRGAFRPARPFDLALDEPDEAGDVPGFLKPIVVRVEAMIVEYALYDLRWWLPTRVRFEGEGRVGSLMTIPLVVETSAQAVEVNEPGLDPDFPFPDGWTRSEVRPCDEPENRRRGRRRGDEARDAEAEEKEVEEKDAEGKDVELCENPARATRIILLPPEESLAAWFEGTDADEIYEEEPFTGEELNDIRDRLGRILLPPAPVTAPNVRLAAFRYNRVEALSGGIRVDVPLDGVTRVIGEARIGLADLVPNLSTSLVREEGNGELRMSAYWRLQDTGDWGNPFALLPSVQALLLAYDDAEYYRVTGVSLGWIGGSRIRTAVRAFAEGHRDAPKETNVSLPHLLSGYDFPENVNAETVTLFGVSGRIRWQAGRDPDRTIFAATAWSEAAVGDRDFVRFAGTGSAHLPVFPRIELAFEASVGSSIGSPPPQRYYYLGGVWTLRGFPNTPSANNGTAFWLGRVELGTRDPLVRFILFSDIGWAGDRSSFTFHDPAISAGLGVSAFDGLVRFDVARSLQGRDPNAWRVYLSVDGLM
ncbi:MAG: hypothetical protein ACWGON_05325 [Gemmatimonadota bacterium]